ncbi:hypothetical protein M2R47_05325 [Moraxella sp. Tifton1]|uniref:hypothetical protein n=1 Tax=Moraxella oculi TaxID=2940516 RepID=UPI00201199DF|nr:hypothetical protein [Moraxella sp. Tifton1]MCL1623660.1 hypothetical protein [Moraxella sp. Tifton1]
MADQNTQNLENLAQDFEENTSQNLNENLNNDDENTSKNEVDKLLNKNKELLDKLAKAKNDNKTLLSENESLKNIQSDFENYKQAEYLEAVLFDVLDVVPSSKDFVKFELEKMGYKVIFDKKSQKYCFINKDNKLVNSNEIYNLKERFANHVYGTRASGTGSGYIDPHYQAKQLCEYKDGVFVGKPRIKAHAQALADFYQSEIDKAQRQIEHYSREIPALLATVDSLPNQVLSNDDKLQFGLK